MAVELVFAGDPDAVRWGEIISVLRVLSRALLVAVRKFFARLFRRRAKVTR